MSPRRRKGPLSGPGCTKQANINACSGYYLQIMDVEQRIVNHLVDELSPLHPVHAACLLRLAILAMVAREQPVAA